MVEKNALNEVLAYTKCTELPKPLRKTDIFVQAIARVRKLNNYESYCIVTNDGLGNPIIKKAFGSMSVIVEVLDIYPLSILSASVVPDMRKKQDIIRFLCYSGESEDYVTGLFATDEGKVKIKQLVYKHCVEIQLRREAEDKATLVKTDKEENNETGKETKDPTGETGGKEEATDF